MQHLKGLILHLLFVQPIQMRFQERGNPFLKKASFEIDAFRLDRLIHTRWDAYTQTYAEEHKHKQMHTGTHTQTHTHTHTHTQTHTHTYTHSHTFRIAERIMSSHIT